VPAHSLTPGISLVRHGLTAFAVVCGGVLLHWSFLREDPWFWRNAGGHPVWQREMVGATFLPLALIYVQLVVSLTWMLFRRPPRHPIFWWIDAAFALGLWVLLLVIVGLTVANNVRNLLEGRPLHAHPAV
jgi:hypothetical protein